MLHKKAHKKLTLEGRIFIEYSLYPLELHEPKILDTIHTVVKWNHGVDVDVHKAKINSFSEMEYANWNTESNHLEDQQPPSLRTG